MAKCKENKLAIDVLTKINNMILNLDSTSKNMDINLTALDDLVANTTKKNELVAGLTGMGLVITEMNGLRTTLRTIQEYLDSNKPDLTEI